MKINPTEIRKGSILKSNEQLEHLHTFDGFPVYMGCVDTDIQDDKYADMIWDIGQETGVIQLRNLLPLELLYLHQHNDGTGKVWENHYEEFALFLSKYNPIHVLEIGGAHDKVAENFWRHKPDSSWTIVEPNPKYITNPRIKIIRDWFDGNFTTEVDIDTIVHSHVLEHTYDPVSFIQHIGSFLSENQMHIFTFPNLKRMLEMKWTNSLNFEHTAFLTEEVIDTILEQEGFEIIEKKYFGTPHSIFYATKKIKARSHIKFKNNYIDHKNLFLEYLNFHKNLISELNRKIKESNQNIYIFGAHIFTQYLINFGLETEKIIGILDNSPIKQGKRLYGTTLNVFSPEILKNESDVIVILKVASYEKEIREQTLTINDKIDFW